MQADRRTHENRQAYRRFPTTTVSRRRTLTGRATRETAALSGQTGLPGSRQSGAGRAVPGTVLRRTRVRPSTTVTSTSESYLPQVRVYFTARFRCIKYAHRIYTVSQKHVPPLACYDFDTCEWILIFFGRNATDKASNQKTFYYATPSNLCFSTTWQNGKHENCIFSLHVLVHCQNSTNRWLISSIFLTQKNFVKSGRCDLDRRLSIVYFFQFCY